MTSARYKFARLDRSGPFFGLRNGQAAIAIAGIAAVTVLLQLTTSALALTLAVATAIATFLLTFAANGGRGLDEWAPVVVSWFADRATGGGVWKARAAHDGVVRSEGDLDLPRELWGLQLHRSEDGPRAFGVIEDRTTGSWLAVLRAEGASWMTDTEEDQVAKARQWGDLLAGIEARALPVSAVQWIEETYPDLGEGVAGDYAARRTIDPGSPEAASMLELIASSAASSPIHSVWVVVQLDARKAATHIRRRGGGARGAASVLEEQVRWLSSRLREMGVDVLGLVAPQQLADLFKNWFDPRGRAERVALGGGIRSWGPVVTDRRPWSYYSSDSAFHRTWWISEWPLREVGPAFLAELIVDAPGYRRLSVTYRARDTGKAMRQIGGEMLKQDTNLQSRSRFGWGARARDRRIREELQRRDEQLAGGARELAYAGYVTLSAETVEELDLQSEALAGAIRRAGCQATCLYGEQELAFLATLPLCRGLQK